MSDKIIKFPAEEKDYDIGIAVPEEGYEGIRTDTLMEVFSHFEDYIVEVVDSVSEEVHDEVLFARFIFRASIRKIYLLRHNGVIITALHPEI